MRSKILQKKVDQAVVEGWQIKVTNDSGFLYRSPKNRKDVKRIGEKIGIDYADRHSVSNVFQYKEVVK